MRPTLGCCCCGIAAAMRAVCVRLENAIVRAPTPSIPSSIHGPPAPNNKPRSSKLIHDATHHDSYCRLSFRVPQVGGTSRFASGDLGFPSWVVVGHWTVDPVTGRGRAPGGKGEGTEGTDSCGCGMSFGSPNGNIITSHTSQYMTRPAVRFHYYALRITGACRSNAPNRQDAVRSREQLGCADEGVSEVSRSGVRRGVQAPTSSGSLRPSPT